MDERSLREIEADRTHVSAEQVENFASFYKVDVKVIYELAKEQVPLQNIVHEAKCDGIVVNQNPDANKGLVEYLMSKIDRLEQRLGDLERR
jgi:hypothetical protein